MDNKTRLEGIEILLELAYSGIPRYWRDQWADYRAQHGAKAAKLFVWVIDNYPHVRAYFAARGVSSSKQV